MDSAAGLAAARSDARMRRSIAGIPPPHVQP